MSTDDFGRAAVCHEPRRASLQVTTNKAQQICSNAHLSAFSFWPQGKKQRREQPNSPPHDVPTRAHCEELRLNAEKRARA